MPNYWKMKLGTYMLNNCNVYLMYIGSSCMELIAFLLERGNFLYFSNLMYIHFCRYKGFMLHGILHSQYM